MKTATGRQLITKRSNRSLLIGVFILALAALSMPFFSVDSSSRVGDKKNLSQSKLKVNSDGAGKRSLGSGWLSALSLPSLAGETVELFAADCTTPKLSFNLGETVCAKTDGVDLTVSNNHYVNWHDPNGAITNGATITQNPQYHLFSLPLNAEVGAWKANIGRVTPAESSIIGNPPVFTVSEGPAIATFASDCTTPQTSFVLGDTVCARISGEPLPDAPNGVPVQRRFNWVNAAGELASATDVTTDPQTNTFALSMSPSARGAWLVNSAGNEGEAHLSTGFSVSDPSALSTDLALSMSNASTVSASSDLFYTVRIANKGPDSAASVQLTDVTPVNTTFVSATQTEGTATFTCNESAGTTTCTATSMPKGDEALIVIIYNVNGGTPDDTVITNTVNVTSSTAELNNADNTFETTATVDSSAPPPPDCVLDCPDNITVTANTTENDVVGAHVTFSSAQIFGDCGAVTSSTPSGSFFPVGTTTVNVTSETNGGSCSFNVIVTEAPLTITCPANQTVTAAEGETTANVNPGNPTTNPTTGVTVTGVRSDDDDDPDTPPLSLTAPYPIGVTYISWTVRETSTGRTATCTQSITVNAADRANLTMSCPADQTVAAPSGSCQATVNPGTPTTNPSDSNVTVEGHRSDGEPLNAQYPAGDTYITWIATDSVNGQSASCTQTITVTTDTGDTTPPTITAPADVSVTTNSCSQIVEESELGTPEASDTGNNCQPGSVTISRSGVPPGNVFPTGTTTITYTATDAAGNSATDTQTVTVTEDPAVPPSVTAPGDVTLYTGPGATSCGVTVSDLNATLGTATASDNCPGVTVARSGVPAGNTFPVGNTTVTYTATDRSGNTANDQQVVTVIDNTAPVISCPADITSGTDDGLCSALVNPGTATATDNCDSNPTIVGTRSDSQPLNAPYPRGTTTITWTATDHASPTPNQSSCVQTITVVDDEAPVIITNGLTPMLWPANHEYRTFNVTDFVTAVTDNCDSRTVSDVVIQKVTSDETENGGGDGNTFDDIIIAADCKSVQVRAERRNSADGRVYTITFKVTDGTGNVGTKTSTIHVPKNLGIPVIDSGPNYTVTGTCP